MLAVKSEGQHCTTDW